MLIVDQLSVEYVQQGRPVKALNKFSLTINEGEAVGLVGASGSGKSTIAMSILRLIRPQEGRITGGHILFDGRDLLALPEKDMRAIRGRDIAMIFQDPFMSLNPVLTIYSQMKEAIRLPSPAAGGRGQGEGTNNRLSEALHQVQLDPVRVLASYPHQLSGGQRQRVMIAMALLNRPRLLLADEPTTALDVLVQKEIMDLLFRLREAHGLALLFITHQTALLKKRVSRIEELKPYAA